MWVAEEMEADRTECWAWSHAAMETTVPGESYWGEMGVIVHRFEQFSPNLVLSVSYQTAETGNGGRFEKIPLTMTPRPVNDASWMSR